MTESKKHHYIPEFYLNGFTDSKNQFYVFDKQTGKIWKSNPGDSFAENYRNTSELLHPETKVVHKTDLLEKELFNYFDGKASIVLSEIRSSRPSDNILTVDRLFTLRVFIATTFWRIPANDKLREKLIIENSFKDLGFGFFHKKTGERNVEMEESFKEMDVWKKIYQVLLPMSSFLNKAETGDMNNWRLYYRENNFHVITDNPIILEKYNGLTSIHEEIICPLSSRVLIVSTKRNKPVSLPPAFSINVDIMLFHNAFRYVASSDRAYLELLSKEASKLSRNSWGDKLKQEIFSSFR